MIKYISENTSVYQIPVFIVYQHLRSSAGIADTADPGRYFNTVDTSAADDCGKSVAQFMQNDRKNFYRIHEGSVPETNSDDE